MIIKRQILHDLIQSLSSKEISLIVGPRQAGKTTLMMFLQNHLEEAGHKTMFFNLDVEIDMAFFESQQKLLRKIQLGLGNEGGFVFIDEIQRKENAGLFLKGLYDMNSPYKFIVSGSGSLELKEKIHESLAGRKRIFELSTLSFLEFVNYKTEYKYEEKIPDYFLLHPDTVLELLKEYMIYGGYPAVVMAETSDEKNRVISELYQSYLEKDIVSLLGIKKTEGFTALVRVMASQSGELTNIAELSNTINISVPTVNNYIWYMQKTFFLSKVTPFFRNIRKEITKSPVFYFSDLGMRNFATGAFDDSVLRRDGGFLFQNFVYHLLKKKVANSSTQINFWRTIDGAEVDFVLNNFGDFIPYEVKYSCFTKPKISKSFRSFIEKYSPHKAYVVHLGEKMVFKIDDTVVEFISVFELVGEGD